MKRSYMKKSHYGFTLIELSIVLVIIGLIIGGILTGQDLISAAGQRAQIAQIEKYNTAVNTFRNKYGSLPGDIPNPYATQFGFPARGQYQGTGNGDGIIAGAGCNNGSVLCWGGTIEESGETVLLWVDLSMAGLVDGSFNTATAYSPPGSDITGAAIGSYLPQAKLGQGNYIYAWSGISSWSAGTGDIFTGINYWGISAVVDIGVTSDNGKMTTDNPGITVQQAYNIDKKMDDGLPQSGSVTAIYLYGSGSTGDPVWTDGTDTIGSPPSTTATAGSATTCMDNGNVAGAKKYSVGQNGGTGMNCGLSFRFQ